MGAFFSDPNFVFFALASSAAAFLLGQALSDSSSPAIKTTGKVLKFCGLPAALLAVVPQVREVCGHLPFECGPLAHKPNQVIEAKATANDQLARNADRAKYEPQNGERDRRLSSAPVADAPDRPRAVPSPTAVAAPSRPVTADLDSGAVARPDRLKSDAGQVQRRPQKPQAQQQQVASVTGSGTAVAVHPATRVLGVAIGAVPHGAAGSEAVAGSNDILVLGIKAELRRLGCFVGRADASWDKSATAAINKFNAHGHRSLSSSPDEESLEILKAFSTPVCPLSASQ